MAWLLLLFVHTFALAGFNLSLRKSLLKKGGAIKNLDIVQEVCPLYRASRAELIWVRGHNLDPGNELADEWANEARRQQLAKKP